MQNKIVYHPNLDKDLKKLPVNVKKRFADIVEILKNNPFVGMPLKGDIRKDRKIRIGNYRIIYRFYPKDKTVFIFRIKSRQEVYKN